ncbi:MAG: DNA repair protein RecN [Prevotella sp.]|nr:DNA repair protein RecN [Prevotella sp.]
MLKHLYIKNFTLIDELNIEFRPGFSVITGETGAGKSIILGALGLLLGNRADNKLIRTGAERCTIEAHFDLSRYDFESFFTENELDYDETDCIVRREITANGKSRAFINDSPVSLAQMRELGEQLVDVHSQHQNLLLRKENFQLSVIDIIATNNKEREAYSKSFSAYQQAKTQLNELRQKLQDSRDNEEFLRFQHKELDEARLTTGEQEELEQQSEIMSHAEEIKSTLYEADTILSTDENGIIGRLRSLKSSLSDIVGVLPAAEELQNRIESSYIELKDISEEISDQLEKVDFDPKQLEEVNDRLDTIYTLQQKFHVSSIDELIEIRDNLSAQLAQIDNSDEELAEQEKLVEQLQKLCADNATKLTSTRTKAAQVVEKQMKKRLVPLGIPNVRFEVQLSEKPLSADGADKVSFLFSANTSTALLPVSEVASGGEIARVMLSLKAMISGAVKLPTIIFDEIDTGVSGRVAEQMAAIMKEMGEAERQVISITHLPQIAAMGTTHYKVMKQELSAGTQTRMTLLSPEERVQEIAQMLSGSNISAAAIDNAKALLNIN